MNATSTFHRPRYEHRQTGWAMLALACVPAVCLGVILMMAPEARRTAPTPLLIGLGVVMAVVVIGFTSLSVMVTPDHLVVRFGIGLFRKSVALADIVGVEVTRTRWYEGWGIHWTRRGTLYNVAGFDAVRIRLANGKAMLVGSDDAQRLAAAIRRATDDRRAAR